MNFSNFDYFVKRGTVLNEMARPVKGLGLKSPILIGVYAKLRTEIRQRNPTLNPNSILLKSMLYLYKLADETEAFDDVQDEIYTSSRKDANTIPPLIVTLINQSLEKGTLDEQKVAELAQNPDNLDDFLAYLETNQGNRAAGAVKRFEKVTGGSKQEHVDTAVEIAPLLAKLNRLQGTRKAFKKTPGDSQPTIEEPPNPNLQIASDIVNILGAISTAKSKLRSNEDLYDTQPKSIWSTKSPQHSQSGLNDILTRVSDKIFNASIETLSNLIEAKIDSGAGQSTEGFLKLVDRIKQSPNTPPALSELFDYIVDRLSDEESKTIEEDEPEIEIEGYDKDLVNKVLTPEEQQVFQQWVKAKRAWRDSLDEDTIRRYEDAYSNLATRQDKTPSSSAVKADSPEDELRKKWEKVALKRGRPLPKLPVKESVEMYMEEQVQKDSKFGPPKQNLLEKGYKRFKNYNHWMAANDQG